MSAFDDWLERLRERAAEYPEWHGEPLCILAWAEVRAWLRRYDAMKADLAAVKVRDVWASGP